MGEIRPFKLAIPDEALVDLADRKHLHLMLGCMEAQRTVAMEPIPIYLMVPR